ncbi:TetR/AcrR family transcriptional regulator [Paenibacillus antibioticophila]|uniref:TetR/AcrR family transcriptional regulator n=1 Tax=Paenibacillus antibioticophila TaxID=1274374 RepID=UPI0005CB794F|nr:TetR/AcrR family transcriptional regulator [Paenibacillus antibioticophila]
MSNRENQRVRLTKSLLKNSLIELMQSKPIHKVTIKELCEHAGINRSTFYLNYKDQFDLLEDIEQEVMLQVRGHIERIVGNFQLLQGLLEYVKDNGRVFSVLLGPTGNSSFPSSFVSSAITTLRANLLLTGSEAQSDYIYHYLTIGCLSMISQWIDRGFDLSTKELSDMIFMLSDGAASVYSNKNT